MLNPSYKRSHHSPIPRITLLSLIETNEKLSKAFNNFDKVSPLRNFSPTFSRNWSINSKKSFNKNPVCKIKSNQAETPKGNTIDEYLSKVLQEFQIKNFDLDQEKLYMRKKTKKNAFDKFFGENGTEEEKKLIDYVRVCEIKY
jgi:hypothetical protein